MPTCLQGDHVCLTCLQLAPACRSPLGLVTQQTCSLLHSTCCTLDMTIHQVLCSRCTCSRCAASSGTGMPISSCSFATARLCCLLFTCSLKRLPSEQTAPVSFANSPTCRCCACQGLAVNAMSQGKTRACVSAQYDCRAQAVCLSSDSHGAAASQERLSCSGGVPVCVCGRWCIESVGSPPL